ncbi:hypothetical protein COOONC_05074, partial [Cooperia oncophora]
LPTSPLRTPSFWIWFCLGIGCNLLCLGLNALFSLVIIMGRQQTFKNSFYAIVIVFSLTVVTSNFCKLAYELVIVLARVHLRGFSCFSTIMDLAVSHFCPLLIFLLGFNRFAAFSSPYLCNRLMERRPLQCILFGLLVFSVLHAILIYKISGLQRAFEQDAVVDYADELVIVQVSNYIFHALPLVSSLFYLIAYRSLRFKREDAISNKTKTLLDSVERCTLNQGIWILVVYLVRLIYASEHRSSSFTYE